MRSALLALVALLVTGGLTPSARLLAQQPALVAPTDALSPADERKALVVPAGFEVQLVAAEPDIQKPMQLAFDAKGRLWVTTSYHYPFAADKGKATDKLFVLSDFDETGKARKVQTFAADLNIPIGILPLPDCDSCIVSSVGEILKLTDTDGDGKADKREVLFSGFGYRDTHGMYNSYTLMPDGWVYACHGFNNESKVKGKDGHEVTMNSGNVFRFRPDGSRIEVYSRGQVNPFGMTIDPWFNIYTADCHSRPVTQVIPGATYESFGTTKDGLGFGPNMFGYDAGGTGLCGVAWYDADHFPGRYRGMMFLGNVVYNRVNMSKVEWTGSTPRAVQQPHFVTSKDPWFRPVDVKLGPDGAVYISDFYNKIIGHYEVPLKHPERDKERGRVWRVVWKGKDGGAKPPKTPREDWTKASDNELLKDLVAPNMTVRMIAGNELLHRARTGKNPKPDDAELLQLLGNANAASAVAGWMSFVEEAKGTEGNYSVLVTHAKSMQFKPDQLSTLLVRAMASREKWGDDERKTALDVLMSFDAPRLKRATVDAMAAHPHKDFVKPLIGLIQKCPTGDTHLKHAARIALRNCLLASPESWSTVRRPADLPEGALVIADVALGIPNESAANFLLGLITFDKAPADRVPAFAEHVGRYADRNGRAALVYQFSKAGQVDPGACTALNALVRGTQAGGRRFGNGETEAILSLVRAAVKREDRATRLAALKLLSDLRPVLPAGLDLNKVVSRESDPRPAVGGLVRDQGQSDDFRATALDALFKFDPASALGTAEKLIDNPQTPPALREKVAVVLAEAGDRNQKQAAKDVIKDVPYRSAVVIAAALAGSGTGGEVLLDAVRQGKAPARLLQEKQVLDRLRAVNVPDLDKQVAALTKGLQPPDQKIADLLKARAAKLPKEKADKQLGAKLFEKHCGACHQVGGMGGKVGPQLDGVGVRGPERLLEDILDPNRNVDAAFRARVLTLTDGTTKSGLMLRVEGEVLVMADDQGKEFRVPTADIETNRETALSPMPANFGDPAVVPEEDFYHLMAYLLDQKSKDPVPKK